jgi:hypothetical protein
MIPADVTVAARRMDDAGRLSCVLRSHPARAPMSAPACTLSSAVQRATYNVQPSTVNLQPLSPLAAAAAPGTGAAALRPTLPLASPPSPPPLPPVQAQRRYALHCPSPRPSPPPLPPVQAQRRCAPTLPLASPLAAAAAPGTGAAALRPYIAPRLVPLASSPLAPTRCRPPFNVQRSTFNLSRPYSSLVTFSFLLVVCFPLAVMRMSLYNES